MFKYILGYLRATRDQQNFDLSAGLPQECLAALTAEAQFYGLQELHHRLTQHQLCSQPKVEYKYVLVKSGDTIARCYAPCVIDEDEAWTFAQPVILSDLQAEGWEYVHSHAARAGEHNFNFIVVLRQEQSAGRLNGE